MTLLLSTLTHDVCGTFRSALRKIVKVRDTVKAITSRKPPEGEEKPPYPS